MTVQGVQKVRIVQLPHVGPMEPWDLHYLRMIDDSGFIDRVYGS